MQTKHLCVLIHICPKGEVGAVEPVKALQLNIFTDGPKAVPLLCIICVIYVLRLSCCPICILLPCGHLLGKGLIFCLSFVMFNYVLSLSHVALSWVWCGS